MFKFNKPILPMLAAPGIGISAAIVIGGTFRSMHLAPTVYICIAAFSFVAYTVLGSIIFRDYKEIADYFVTPGYDRLSAENLFMIPIPVAAMKTPCRKLFIIGGTDMKQ